MKLASRAARHAEPVIRPREDGTLDEVVVSHPAVVHLEQMDEGSWWLGIDLVDGRRVTVNLSTKRNARVYGMADVSGARLDIVAIEAELGRKVVSKSELKRLAVQMYQKLPRRGGVTALKRAIKLAEARGDTEAVEALQRRLVEVARISGRTA